MAATYQVSAAQTPRAVPPPRIPQRACARCARSKQRCVWSANGGRSGGAGSTSCDRPRKKRGKSTRVKELEHKVDGIMSLLAANQYAPLPVSDPLRNNTTHSTPVPAISCVHGVHPTSTPSQSCNIGAATNTETIQLAPGYSITAQEAEDILSTYREKLTPHFPFVPLAPTESALQLHRQSPLLFHVIVMVTLPGDLEVQLKLRQHFRETIARKMIVHSEKSVEMLQAILVYIIWSDFHFYMCAQGTDFIQLAIALVMDLGLGKPPSQSWGTIPRLLVDDAADLLKGARMKELHSLEDMRAMLGCFYLVNL
ncbi:hypothetical protein DL768_007982 [Monosporascus sp. mg162]|nr:hypothetical protein DL768_007982 [Monosporascus sp. mg162]